VIIVPGDKKIIRKLKAILSADVKGYILALDCFETAIKSGFASRE
jgi:hypothetical protein